jgi:hypothetical protein
VQTPAGIENGAVISLRRGDYVRLGWDLPLEYYDSALRLLEPGNIPIWIIGDDALVIELVSEKWRRQGLNVLALPDLGISNTRRDLALLVRAKNVIMSNSTFCWWGVVTGNLHRRETSRRIISPNRWLPLPGADSLINPSWESVFINRFRE